MNFEKLDIKHKDLFSKYKPYTNHISSVHNFIELYIWKDALDLEVCEENEILYIRRLKPAFAYIPPVVVDDSKITEAIDKIKEDCTKNNEPFIILDAEQWFVDKLKNNNIDMEVTEDRDNSEYLYDGQKLKTLSGKKLHSKKNHYNQFIKNNNYSFKDLKDCMDDALDMEERWLKEKSSDFTIGEYEGIKNCFKNWDLLNLKGIAIFVDDVCQGFTISEDTSENSVLCHVEKANDSIKGAFTFVNSQNIVLNHPNAEIVNREQDLGIEGLRKAKLSWKPIGFVDKFKILLK